MRRLVVRMAVPVDLVVEASRRASEMRLVHYETGTMLSAGIYHTS